MATANLSPPEMARVQRQQRLYAGLQSVDPVERYRARDQLQHDASITASTALVDKALRVERSFKEQQRYYDYLEKHPPKYKILER